MWLNSFVVICGCETGEGAAVLLRSLEPLDGQEQMKSVRASNSKSAEKGDKLKTHQLCNGPSQT